MSSAQANRPEANRPERSRSASIDPRLFVRRELRELSAYTLDQSPFVHKLDQNEVPWDLPSRLKREAARRLEQRNWAHYPDFHGDRLRELLARRHGVEPENVLVGNGSNELLGIALEGLVGPGKEVLGADPTFGLYEMFIRRAGGKPRSLAPRPDLTLPIAELLDEIERDPERPLLLCSPNNPTGDAATPADVGALLGALRAPLLLDNAYAEFCRHDYRPLLSGNPHLLIFRTFSKAWSLAGLRLGYLLADERLVGELIKIKLPYNVNHAAAVIGEVALENPAFAERAVRVVCARRGQWREMLESFDFEVFASEGNFLLVRAERSQELRLGLAERGILIREMGHYPGLEGCVRFAVGSGPALRATRRALSEMRTASVVAAGPVPADVGETTQKVADPVSTPEDTKAS